MIEENEIEKMTEEMVQDRLEYLRKLTKANEKARIMHILEEDYKWMVTYLFYKTDATTLKRYNEIVERYKTDE